jgi:signal transduction histidine kinase
LARPVALGLMGLGALALVRHVGTRDATVAFAVAHQAAVAIENARLHERAQHVAVLEERQRLARELHDSVTQALYGMSLYAEAGARALADGAANAAETNLRDIRETAQEALSEMRPDGAAGAASPISDDEAGADDRSTLRA